MENGKEFTKIINSNLRIVQTHYLFQIATCAQCVSLLQNSEMFQNTTYAQSVHLLQNSDIFENKIKNCQKFKFIH